MKKYVFIYLLFASLSAYAQEKSFFDKLTGINTQEEAKEVVATLAAQLKGKYIFYKIKEFDNGLLRVVYTPEGMGEEDIKAQADYEDSFVADFKTVENGNGKSYRFEKVKARYDALFPVWKQFFKADAQPDKKTQRYTDTGRALLFSFINLGDVWAIGR